MYIVLLLLHSWSLGKNWSFQIVTGRILLKSFIITEFHKNAMNVSEKRKLGKHLLIIKAHPQSQVLKFHDLGRQPHWQTAQTHQLQVHW